MADKTVVENTLKYLQSLRATLDDREEKALQRVRDEFTEERRGLDATIRRVLADMPTQRNGSATNIGLFDAFPINGVHADKIGYVLREANRSMRPVEIAKAIQSYEPELTIKKLAPVISRMAKSGRLKKRHKGKFPYYRLPSENDQDE